MAFVLAIFFIASAGASSAYLTVSRDLPDGDAGALDRILLRGGTAAGGIAGPLLFGHLIATGSQSKVAVGFFIGAAVMAIGGLAEILFGVKAEQEQLESVAKPLTADEAEEEGVGGEEAKPRKRGPRSPSAGRSRRAAATRRCASHPGCRSSAPT